MRAILNEGQLAAIVACQRHHRSGKEKCGWPILQQGDDSNMAASFLKLFFHHFLLAKQARLVVSDCCRGG